MDKSIKNRQTVRLKGYDYSQNYAYFVTVCVQDRVNSFGAIQDGQIKLNALGKIAKEEWKRTLEIRKDMNVQLDEFVIMPNHIHAIIIIGINQYNMRGAIQQKDARHRVPTEQNKINKFGVQSKNLSSIIRGYKSAVTIYARGNNIDFKWQARFYEHIIREENDLNRIRKYVTDNPFKWEEDEYYK